MMSFAFLATFTSIAALLLAFGWLFAGRLMITRWGGEPSDMALVIGRRIGAVYLSMSLLYFFLRNTDSQQLIMVLSMLGLFANGLLAILGIFEFARKQVGAAMLISVGVEVFLVFGFAQLVFAWAV